MRSLAVLLVVALLGAGCGTTVVQASDRNARVWVDGELVGKGQGEVTLRGLPGTAHILARTDDGRRQQASMRRSFTVGTFFLGLITYGVCWVACWEYPTSFLVDLPPAPAAAGSLDASVAPAADPWLQPPAGWRPR
jgi:hypothetical protein